MPLIQLPNGHANILHDSQMKAFQQMLDEDEGEHWVRGRIGDWLGDRGHPWCWAYWWMGQYYKHPMRGAYHPWMWAYLNRCYQPKSGVAAWKMPCVLPYDVFRDTVYTFDTRLDAEIALCAASVANPDILVLPDYLQPITEELRNAGYYEEVR